MLAGVTWGIHPNGHRSAQQNGYNTNHDTKQDLNSEKMPQVIENMVELVGIELLRILKTDRLLIRRESYNAHNA
jgi:hypothetical protein